jgi:hypothetical protein
MKFWTVAFRGGGSALRYVQIADRGNPQLEAHTLAANLVEGSIHSDATAYVLEATAVYEKREQLPAKETNL